MAKRETFPWIPWFEALEAVVTKFCLLRYKVFVCFLFMLLSWLNYSWTMKIEAIYSSETVGWFSADYTDVISQNIKPINTVKFPKIERSNVKFENTGRIAAYRVVSWWQVPCGWKRKVRANVSPSDMDTCDVRAVDAVMWGSTWL
jgi:hypothetical protein